jgi:GAF domain-containing protein
MSDTTSTELVTAYGQLLNLLMGSPDLDEFLDQVVTLAAQVVTPAAACGLTTRRDGHPFTVANSSDLATQVDEIQYGADEGPCLDALRSGEVVQVDDLSVDERWPQYRPHALVHGVTSSLSLPLPVDKQTIGALNLYSSQVGAFSGPARTHAEAFAGQCAAALTLTLRHSAQSQIQQQLAAALGSRSVIDQAIGILMGQQRCTAAEAFEILRQASQHRNRKLRELAAELITNLTGHAPQPGPEFRVETGPADADLRS